MKYSNPLSITIIFLMFLTNIFSQVVDQETVLEELNKGNVETAEKWLNEYLVGEERITADDSLFIFRHLGIINSATPENREKSKQYFINMLKIDPAAHLVDTYASHSTITFFRQVKKEFQVKFGGSSLLPKVLVMDANGEDIKKRDKSSMARQFIEEIQSRTRIFNVIDRETMEEDLKKAGKKQEDCKVKDCYLELGSLLQADKVVLMDVNKVANTYTLSLKYYDVLSKSVESLLKKSNTGSMDPLILEGIGQLAEELQKENAAWLQLSVQPANSYLELDGEPSGGFERIPVNAGKHTVCASAPGHQSKCKSLKVQKNDALTHTLVLKPVISKSTMEVKTKKNKTEAEVEVDEEDVDEEGSSLVWWMIGGLVIIGGALAIVFNVAG